MSTQFSLSNQRQPKRFSIDDAFEEETDEAIKVYGSTPTPTAGSPQVDVRVDNGRGYKLANDTSRDSDSLIQDCYDASSQDYIDRSCFRHPKVRENWRMVLAAVTLLIIGVGLLTTGTISLAEPNSGLQGSVFLLAGFICFVPGAYHVVYIYLAAKGKRGYHFHNLPLFT
ncbi:transmembrane protein 134 [Tribolium castaneum]|uniref:Transmembrane protein 134-like Protein n=1 Tax=Tribolium castaneum TaxID=7070 RepID=D2A630_TRICA|nr:PREDICTED: transmembrane protein 134 [Tribolium castaneum]EFA04989.1 Transmembrane protein 134-like Protein [Tribolium castaneum]|eukprot:XP_972380.1 PREDICTED: transmembrane protein 134 [Tribolium castaneum]